MPTTRAERKRKAADAGFIKFRVCRKSFGLTYSAPEGKEHPFPSRQFVADFLEEKFGPNLFLICQEFHKDDRKHYHVAVKFDSVIDNEDPRLFDLEGIHPNILSGPYGPGWLHYLKKSDPEFLTNMESSPYKQALQASNVEEGMEILAHAVPGDIVRFGEAIERNLRRRLAPKKPARIYTGPYVAGSYPYNWRIDTHSLLLWGPPASCKTNYAKYLMAHLVSPDYEYIRGSHEAVKKLSLTKPFIHDEINCLSDKCPPENSREITDIEDGGEIICRHSNVTIPPGLPRIFIANFERPFRDPAGAVYGRRVVSLEITI